MDAFNPLKYFQRGVANDPIFGIYVQYITLYLKTQIASALYTYQTVKVLLGRQWIRKINRHGRICTIGMSDINDIKIIFSRDGNRIGAFGF